MKIMYQEKKSESIERLTFSGISWMGRKPPLKGGLVDFGFLREPTSRSV